MPVEKYVLKRDMVCEQYGRAFFLPRGSVCEYFSHTDTYLFEAQDNYVPYFLRTTVESLPKFFRAMRGPTPVAADASQEAQMIASINDTVEQLEKAGAFQRR